MEHPYLRLLQVLFLVTAIVLGLNQLGLLDGNDDGLRLTRVGGADPVSASASVARESGGGRDTVIIAGEGALADGVVATGLAGALDAPILLNERDRLSPQIRDVVRELDPERVILIGGTNAMQTVVESTLRDDLRLEVERIAGPSRFDTASLVAERFAAETEPPRIDGLRSALLVPAEDVPASLEAGALAASRADPIPVLLSQGGQLPAPTRRMVAALDIEQLFVVSPAGAAATPTLTGFDGTVRIIQGPTGPADTTAEIRGFRPPRVVVVPAGDEARTLIAGPLAGREAGVILTSQTVRGWLTANCGTIRELFVIAEPDIITDTEVAVAQQAATVCD